MWRQALAGWIEMMGNKFFSAIYSDDDFPSSIAGRIVVCPVSLNSEGERFIVIDLSPYVFDKAVNAFVPVLPPVPTETSAMTAAEGLGQGAAAALRARVGPNVIALEKPDALSVVWEEFNKPFYSYQLFMAWTWMVRVLPRPLFSRVFGSFNINSQPSLLTRLFITVFPSLSSSN